MINELTRNDKWQTQNTKNLSGLASDTGAYIHWENGANDFTISRINVTRF